MKLNVDYKIVNVKNEDMEMEDTFNIKVKILTYKENIALLENHNIDYSKLNSENEEIKFMDYAKDVFINSVVEWENIEDSNGKDLECNDKNKSAIFDFNPAFAQKVIEIASNKINDSKKK